MKYKKINIAIIGGGINSTIGRAHISALRIDGNYKIIAGVFSRSKKDNKKTIDIYKLDNCQIYNNIDKLIEYELKNIDAFLIITDTPSHYEILKKIINLNKIIICEKPSSKNLKELFYIKNKIEKNKIKFFPFYNYLGYPIINDIKYLINKNKIGRLQNIYISMNQQGLTKSRISKIKSWRLHDKDLSTIQLDLGVHVASILNCIVDLQKIKKLISLEQKTNKSKVVHTVDSWINFANDAMCKLSISKYKIGNRNNLNIEIYGDKGSLIWNHENPEILIYYNQKGKKFNLDRNDDELEFSKSSYLNRYTVGHPYGFIEAMANYYYKIFNSINKKKNNKIFNPVSIYDEIKIFKLITKLKKSSQNNRWIDFK